MKKTFRIFLTAAALSSMMAIPAFAAETRDGFKAETSVLYEQMQELNTQINTLRQQNNEFSKNYRELGKEYRENGTLPVSEETWNAIKEIRQELTEYQSSKESSTVKEMRAAAKAAAENGDYDGALATINQVLQSKQTRLESAKAANALWLEIQALLGE